MANEVAKNQVSPVQRLRQMLSAESVQEQFRNSLKENSGAFVASVIDLYASDSYLQQCNPNEVVMEALKAATLKLPVNKQLGFAYIVPYRDKKGVQHPQFQIGYKGYIQLAMRAGQYRYLNAGVVYEGMSLKRNWLTGEVSFEGEPTSEKAIGYFAYLELLNGFSKTLYMTLAEVQKHAQRYSKSISRDTSVWRTNFDEMATKTVTRLLLSKYGIMSTEMVTALTTEPDPTEDAVAAEIAEQANSETIDVDFSVTDPGDGVGPGQAALAEADKLEEPEQGAKQSPKKAEQQKLNVEPGF